MILLSVFDLDIYMATPIAGEERRQVEDLQEVEEPLLHAVRSPPRLQGDQERAGHHPGP